MQRVTHAQLLSAYVPHMQGDFEHITVQATRSGELIAVWYAAHGTESGAWVPADRIGLDEDSGRIKVYVAYHSYASYPRKGTWWYTSRQLTSSTKFANDETDDQGATLAPTELRVLTNKGSASGKVPRLPAGTKGQFTTSYPITGSDAGPPSFEPQYWASWPLYFGATGSTSQAPPFQSWFHGPEEEIGRDDGNWDTRK